MLKWRLRSLSGKSEQACTPHGLGSKPGNDEIEFLFPGAFAREFADSDFQTATPLFVTTKLDPVVHADDRRVQI